MKKKLNKVDIKEIDDVIEKVNNDPILKAIDNRRKADSTDKMIELLMSDLRDFHKEISDFRGEISDFKKDVSSELQDLQKMVSDISINSRDSDMKLSEKIAWLKSEFDDLRKNHCTPQQFLLLQKVLKRAASGDKFWATIKTQYGKQIMLAIVVSSLTAFMIFIKKIFSWITHLLGL
jgi:hypothetical protein